MSFLRKMFSGGLDANDPRRFLIEAMLGAIEADGDVTEEEMETFQTNLEQHQLFEGMTGDACSRLIDIAADAIRDAGGADKRTKAIAAGLTSPGHRLAAYSLACEVCIADAELPESEIRYLETLQKALEIEDGDAKDLFEAARSNSGLLTLEEKTKKMLDLLPNLVECMALMAAADEQVHIDELRTIRTVLGKIPDMAVLTAEELDEAIHVSFERIKEVNASEHLVTVAETVVRPTDRYWTTAYMMIVALADGKTDWREVSFLKEVQGAFELNDELMDRAMATAALFPQIDIGGAIDV